MSDLAILVSGQSGQPRTVRLGAGSNNLELKASDGSIEAVPWWRLYRVSEDSTTHRFWRLDRKSWELRVTAGGDRDLLSHVGKRPFHRLIHPLRRLEALKVAAGLILVLVTIGQHAPPDWTGKFVPARAQQRLTDSMVAQLAPTRCAREGGEAALRKILVRLDPDLGHRVRIVAINGGAFIVTSTPGDTIVMYRSSLTEIEPAALPALLAHELSHIRNGDPIAATIRHNGFLDTWAEILEANGRQQLLMDYSGVEERRADLEAMAMMRRAGLPLRPAADMFEQMRVSKAQNGFFGYDQRDFHFGIDARAQRWATAAQGDSPLTQPLLTDRETDALYNFCWSGPIRPLPGPTPKDLPAPTESGRGGITASSHG